jgi:hypothetical protein
LSFKQEKIMSKQLEQVLELLLNEDVDAAREKFHDYMVGKARDEYQRQLDEEDEGNPFADADEGDADEGDADEGDADEGDGDIEDRVDDLESTLADLQAEFEKLMGEEPAGDDFGGDIADGDVVDQVGDFEDDVAFDMDGGDGDLDDQLAEATKLQDKAPKAKDGNSDADGKPSPFSQTPKKADWSKGVAPVKIKDGGEGKSNHGGSVKHDTKTNRTRDVDVEKKDARQPMTRGKQAD